MSPEHHQRADFITIIWFLCAVAWVAFVFVALGRAH
jgi:hypothetical protein